MNPLQCAWGTSSYSAIDILLQIVLLGTLMHTDCWGTPITKQWWVHATLCFGGLMPMNFCACYLGIHALVYSCCPLYNPNAAMTCSWLHLELELQPVPEDQCSLRVVRRYKGHPEKSKLACQWRISRRPMYFVATPRRSWQAQRGSTATVARNCA